MKTLHRTLFAVMAVAALAVSANASTTVGANADHAKKRSGAFAHRKAALSAFTLLPAQQQRAIADIAMSAFTLLPAEPTQTLPSVAQAYGQGSTNTP